MSLSEVLYSCYDNLDKATLKQTVKDIVGSGERLKSYINNITDLSKLSSLSYELQKKEFNFTELVKSRPFLYTKIFSDDKKQKFKLEVEEDIIIDGDEYLITQAIDNLISNAVKYGKDKEVMISLKRTPDKRVEFKIKDQGIGIAKHELFSIFEAFAVSSKTKTPAGGRGIGLALVKKIIAAHNGRIWATSDTNGSSFYFVI